MANTIVCPHCKKPIKITEALTSQIEEKTKKELEEQYEKQLQEAKEKATEHVKKEVEEKYNLEFKDLKKELEEKNKKVEEFRSQELQLREEKRRLEEKEKDLKLEVERKIDEEKKRIEEIVLKQAVEEHRIKDLESEKKIADLQKKLEEALTSSKVGSQQLQGEVLELDVEQTLRSAFSYDLIEQIGKGIHGADIRHIVKSERGTVCGTILWECKNTKAWDKKWVPKLKEDLRRESADICVIVSTLLPAEINNIGQVDGVWVCNFSLVIPLAILLRKPIYDVARQKAIASNREQKADFLYEYITSHEFRQRIEAIVEVYKEMDGQILKERAAFEKAWKAREGQVQKLFAATSQMVGDMQGKIGSSLGQIKGLDMFELESGEK